MYKLLIVDDEEIEREGIAQLIGWERYDIELIGTAWNGADALHIIEKDLPDIVLTDIKMPIMDGIDLIRKCRCDYPDVVFVVISGYGEFECTSQAMAEGVHHYILKPCGEEEIIPVLEKVKLELLQRTRENLRRSQVQVQLKNFSSRAKEQYFRSILLGLEPPGGDAHFFPPKLQQEKFCVLTLRFGDVCSRPQQQRIFRSFCEIYGDTDVLMLTAIQTDLLLLMRRNVMEDLPRVLSVLRGEWAAASLHYVRAALTGPHEISELYGLYSEISALFRAASGLEPSILLGQAHASSTRELDRLMNLRALSACHEYGEILYLAASSFFKMTLSGLHADQKLAHCRQAVQSLYDAPFLTDCTPEDPCTLFAAYTDALLAQQIPRQYRPGHERSRLEYVHLASYQNLSNPEFNRKYLASKVLFMNEDYLGKLLTMQFHMKFSDYLLQLRIRLAQDLLQYRPSLKISELASCIGYAPDAQYFSKAFRKVTGMSPKNYQIQLKKSALR